MKIRRPVLSSKIKMIITIAGAILLIASTVLLRRTIQSQYRGHYELITGTVLTRNDPEILASPNFEDHTSLFSRTYYIKIDYPGGGYMINQFNTPKCHKSGDKLKLVESPTGWTVQRLTFTDITILITLCATIFAFGLFSTSSATKKNTKKK